MEAGKACDPTGCELTPLRAGQADLGVRILWGPDSASTRHPPLKPLPDPIPLKIQFPIGQLSRRRSGQIYTFPVPRPRGLIAKNTAGTRTSKDFLSQTGSGGGLGIPIAIPRRASRASARGGITLHLRTHHQPIRHYPTMNLSSSLRTLAISIDLAS